MGLIQCYARLKSGLGVNSMLRVYKSMAVDTRRPRMSAAVVANSKNSVKEYPLQLVGRAKTFVARLPVNALEDLSGQDLRVYIYCWIDSTRGQGGHVHYNPCDIASDSRVKPKHDGEFSVSVNVRESGDPDLIKIMACMRMKDQETKNTRNATLAVSAAQLDRMLTGEEQALTMFDQFTPGNYTEVRIWVANAADFANHASTPVGSQLPRISFRRSSLWDIETVFRPAVTSASNSIMSVLVSNRMEPTEGGAPFLSGLTSWEWGGAQFLQSGAPSIGPLTTHYALMNSQEEAIKRPFPLAIVAYHIHLRLLHSGLTPEGALKLADAPFGHFIAECCQITRDAGLVPYQRDIVPGFECTLSGSIKIAARGTENMVPPIDICPRCWICDAFLLVRQGLPCGAPQFMGRALRKLSPIAVPGKATLEDCRRCMEGALRQVAEENRTSILEHLGLVGPGPGRSSVPLLTDCDRSLLKDDCESSAQLAVLCRLGLMGAPATVDGLQKILGEWPMFKNFTPRCYSLMSQIINRGAEMLRSGTLKVTTAVGLATSAAASDVQKKTAEFNGHCFNVACVATPVASTGGGEGIRAMDKLSFAIMEGTAPSCSILVSETTPQIPVKIWSNPSNPRGFTTRIMSFNQYCNALVQGVNELTRVINAPNGGRSPGGGWPIQGAPVTGWTSTSILMNALDSDPDSYLEFYNRVVYMGWKCSPGASGCMPIERCQTTPGVGDQRGSDTTPRFLTGCHPYHLNDRSLQAIDAYVPSDKQPVMDAIMDEAHPPLVDEPALKRLAELWAPCSPFSDVNNQRRFITSREEGVEYVRVACMESPGIPEFVPLVCLAKHTAFKLADKINVERPDSDGARFVSEEKPQGTGFHGFMEIPCKAVIPTAMNSLRRALKMLNWPGYVPLGDE